MINESLAVARPSGRGELVGRAAATARDSSTAAAAGLLAAAVLVALYLGLVTWGQGLEHAVRLLGDEWYLVGPIAGGFGLQIGLFVRVRQLARRRAAAPTALAASGTGASTAGMLACCAHHVSDVVPLLGLSGATVFLNDYRIAFMAAGLTVNAVGVGVMLRLLQRETRAGGPVGEVCR